MRLFIAIDLPEPVRAALAREQARLRDACGKSRDIRWTRPEGLHLTLKFLGEVAAGRLPEISHALRPLRFDAFEVDVAGFGFFPSARRPRVFWVGLEAPPALEEVATRVEAAMGILGFAPENRSFQPHLTLARFENHHPQPELEAALQKTGAGSFGRFTVSEFFLFASKLRPEGAQYSKLANFPGEGGSDSSAALRTEG
ncbi:MAG TPA: RNA 2',3'-cyclic phosphodiesterase [Terriglobia bacterium]|nr:RNA 2',3'-cyclic phosphodiesterase [Terriglobia bacterium]